MSYVSQVSDYDSRLFAIMSVADQLDIATADVCLSHQVTAMTVPTDAPWPRKLEAAQNVIFCKEVFAQVNNDNTGYSH